jgi:hypothetical protein
VGCICIVCELVQACCTTKGCSELLKNYGRDKTDIMTGFRFHFCEAFGTLQEWNRDGGTPWTCWYRSEAGSLPSKTAWLVSSSYVLLSFLAAQGCCKITWRVSMATTRVRHYHDTESRRTAPPGRIMVVAYPCGRHFPRPCGRHFPRPCGRHFPRPCNNPVSPPLSLAS